MSAFSTQAFAVKTEDKPSKERKRSKAYHLRVKKRYERTIEDLNRTLGEVLITNDCLEVIPRAIINKYSELHDCAKEYAQGGKLPKGCPEFIEYTSRNNMLTKVRLYYNVASGGVVKFSHPVPHSPNEYFDDPGWNLCFKNYSKKRAAKDEAQIVLEETQAKLIEVNQALQNESEDCD